MSSNITSKLAGLVTVITAAYNAEDSIENVVKSVASQGSVVREHIVVDDGSSDETLNILKRLQAEYAHLRVHHQDNQGAAAARNLGIRMAEARYVAFLDSDDYWLPSKLVNQIAFMEESGSVFSYGDYDAVDAGNGTVLAEYELPQSLSYRELLCGCPIGCLTVAYNQEYFGKRYMPAVRRGQDWALWLALTRDGTRAEKYPGRHAIYNVSQGSLSSNKLKKIADVYQVYRSEERIGVIATLYYLTKHAIYAQAKSWRLARKIAVKTNGY